MSRYPSNAAYTAWGASLRERMSSSTCSCRLGSAAIMLRASSTADAVLSVASSDLAARAALTVASAAAAASTSLSSSSTGCALGSSGGRPILYSGPMATPVPTPTPCKQSAICRTFICVQISAHQVDERFDGCSPVGGIVVGFQGHRGTTDGAE